VNVIWAARFSNSTNTWSEIICGDAHQSCCWSKFQPFRQLDLLPASWPFSKRASEILRRVSTAMVPFFFFSFSREAAACEQDGNINYSRVLSVDIIVDSKGRKFTSQNTSSLRLIFFINIKLKINGSTIS